MLHLSPLNLNLFNIAIIIIIPSKDLINLHLIILIIYGVQKLLVFIYLQRGFLNYELWYPFWHTKFLMILSTFDGHHI